MDSLRHSTLALALRDDAAGPAGKTALVRRAFDIEFVTTPSGSAYDFHWDGSRAYLAWHHMVLSDGEMRGDDFRPTHGRDLRDRITFFPDGVRASGWAQQSAAANAFAVLYFDEDWLFNQLETPPAERSLKPLVHFSDTRLAASMQKLGALAREPGASPRLVVDSAALLVGAELLQAHGEARDRSGSLSAQRLKAAKDFIEAHLFEDVALADIAATTDLSAYHFVRAFKIAEGVTPYRYLLLRRIEHAKQMIAEGALPIEAIGRHVGFKSANHFSRAFREIARMSPRAFRKQSQK